MKTKEQIGLELEVLGDYLGAILYTESTKMVGLMKAYGFQQELEEGEHGYFCKHIDEYLFKVRKRFEECGFLIKNEVSDEEIKEAIKNGVYHKTGKQLACQIRDKFIKTGKSEQICPMCNQKPYIDIDGKFFEHVLIKCPCGYVSLYEKGI